MGGGLGAGEGAVDGTTDAGHHGWGGGLSREGRDQSGCGQVAVPAGVKTGKGL